MHRACIRAMPCERLKCVKARRMSLACTPATDALQRQALERRDRSCFLA